MFAISFLLFVLARRLVNGLNWSLKPAGGACVLAMSIVELVMPV